MANISFNNKNYNIEIPAEALAALKSHLQTNMAGSGAAINLDGTTYNIDSAKLSAATTNFVTHLGTISGNGHKVVVNGVEYGVSADKVADAVGGLENVLGELNNGGSEPKPEVITHYTQEDIDNSYGLLMPCGATNPLYVVASVSPDFSTATITKNGDDSDGLMVDLPYGYIADLGLPLTTIIIENGVANIGEYFISNCQTVTSVTISDSVTSIGVSAFRECGSITSIVIPNGVTSIGDATFSHCSSLTSIAISDSVTNIGAEAFYNCSNLTSIAIPDSVTSIGEAAFRDCTSLISITIPNSVTNIGKFAFNNCYSLTSINIPSSVTSIGELAFRGCDGLTSITVESNNTVYYSKDNCLIEIATNKLIHGCQTSTIPNGVTSIGNNAFFACPGLTSITIPDSVTGIGELAFWCCLHLTSITFKGTVAQWNSITKGDRWNENVPATYVKCSDGQVAL